MQGNNIVIYGPGAILRLANRNSQGNTPVTPSETEGRKGKGKRNSKGLITTKRWTPIAAQRTRKPQSPSSIQGKPTLRNFTGKINIINPVATFKGKFPKAVDNRFVQCTVKEEIPELSRVRRPGQFGHHSRLQDTEGNHTHSAICLLVKQKPQTRGVEDYGSSSSAPPTPQKFIPIEHGQQEVQPRIPTSSSNS
ncbi:hypothetical protein O181_073411 [Austropuccinia psidii MF-1]|uniref:Uncharacterized protein n=1 Tax=Austropuccinia psidii MF-1 TaxID=1389203 RepID=A0A9Q3I894_9BASI|nr:hypothetical protein [Austropuccinia psidii MF-1]